MPMARGSRIDWLVSGLSFVLGGWMVFDGSRKLLTGLYTGEDILGLGPWASIVSWLGIRPSDMALPFAFLGGLWIVNAVVLFLGTSGRYERAILSGALTLFYLIPGTIISLIIILLSARERRRDRNVPRH